MFQRIPATCSGASANRINKFLQLESGFELTSRTRWRPLLGVDSMLANPAALFALVHNRLLYPPARWAAWDLQQIQYSWDLGHFITDFSAKCIALYDPMYGQVVIWDAAKAHRGDMLGFPRARLVLEAQRNLCQVLDRLVGGLVGALLVTSDSPSRTRVMGTGSTSRFPASLCAGHVVVGCHQTFSE